MSRQAGDVGAGHEDGAGVDGHEAADDVQQRRLAGAVGADEPDHLAALGGDADVVERAATAEADGDVGATSADWGIVDRPSVPAPVALADRDADRNDRQGWRQAAGGEPEQRVAAAVNDLDETRREGTAAGSADRCRC